MPVKYEPWRKEKQWVAYWKSTLTGKTFSHAFDTEDAANQFEIHQNIISKKEKDILRKKREKKIKCNNITVKSLLESFLRINFTNATTIKQNTYHAAHIIGAFGKRMAQNLTVNDMLAFIEAQKLRGLQASTAYRRISILKSALNWGVGYGLLTSNPLASLRLPHIRTRRVAPPTSKEAIAILKAASPHVQRVIILGWYCGARIGPSELFKLTRHDIDLENGMLRIQSASKNDKEDARDIPIHNALIPYLRAWLKEDANINTPYIIHWRGKPVRSINRAWHSALNKAKIFRKIRPYDLRHAYCTYSIADGADIKTLAEIMGHKNTSMILKVYQHVLDSQKIKAVQVLKDRLRLTKREGITRMFGIMVAPKIPFAPPNLAA